MAKDSQIDPKEVRRAKAKGGATVASDEQDNEKRNAKKKSVKQDNFQSNK